MNFYGTDQHKQIGKKFDEQVFSNISFDAPDRVKELDSEYCIQYYFYADKENCIPGFAPVSGEICRLYKNGELVFAWKKWNGISRLARRIHHSDGNDYLVFDEDLYGYSVLDLKQLECMHYLPAESYETNLEAFKETFLWCDCFYQPETNLLAVEGCEWAGPYDVIVLDFSHPMAAVEAAQWFSIHEKCRESFPHCDGLGFVKWEGKTLVCKAFGEKPKGFDLNGKCKVDFI